VRVFIAPQQFADDGQRLLSRQSLCGADELISDDGARFLTRHSDQTLLRPRRDFPGIAQKPNRPGANVFTAVLQQLAGQVVVESAAHVKRPQTLQRKPVVFSSKNGVAQMRNDFRVPPLRQNLSRLPTEPVVPMSEQLNQFL